MLFAHLVDNLAKIRSIESTDINKIHWTTFQHPMALQFSDAVILIRPAALTIVSLSTAKWCRRECCLLDLGNDKGIAAITLFVIQEMDDNGNSYIYASLSSGLEQLWMLETTKTK